jgi:2,5-diamino-6-(ribosylamino)-4(3H)-pyrimidinone 5'-phosphate reductase
MFPRVILHNGVSVDGRLDWFTGDIGLYYELVATFEADATLCGSNTILAAAPTATEDTDHSNEKSAPPEHWLAIVDSRGRISNLAWLRRQPYWRDIIMLCSADTPATYVDDLRRQKIEFIVAGQNRVDLRQALAELKSRYGVNRLRIDSGGTLNGVLLRAGLVNEVSLLVNPALVGGTSPGSIYTAPDLTSGEGIIPLRLTHLERQRDDTVWLRYEVVK